MPGICLTFLVDKASMTDSRICSLELNNSDKRICFSAGLVDGFNKSSSLDCHVAVFSLGASGIDSKESAKAEKAASLLVAELRKRTKNDEADKAFGGAAMYAWHSAKTERIITVGDNFILSVRSFDLGLRY